MTVQPTTDTVSVTIDGFEIVVPKGTLVIRAAEMLGIQIPRFCDHPLLDPIGACRQCLVDVEGQRKPMASCTTTCTEGMVAHTQLTSAVAEKAQRGVMELLLINHPLDCPMCDKGGECPLQNQAMSSGQGETRFTEAKREFPKPVPISTEVLLDRERCISCTRCVRVSEEIAGDEFIEFVERGPCAVHRHRRRQAIQLLLLRQHGADMPGGRAHRRGLPVPVAAVRPGVDSWRVRALRLGPPAAHRPPARPGHPAAGRRRPRRQRGVELRQGPLGVRLRDPSRTGSPTRWSGADGVLAPASWPHAIAVAAKGLTAVRDGGYGDATYHGPRGAGFLVGGRLTLEDSYAYAKFARVASGTNDVDMRARPHSAEEEQFLAACVAGRGIGVSYADLERAPAVLLVGLEPEDESPIIFLRLRKAVRQRKQQVFSIAALASWGLAKLSGQLLATVPGDEAAALTALAAGGQAGGGAPAAGTWRRASEAIAEAGAIILVGERLAEVPGALAAVARLALAAGAKLAWVPRRAGERGAIEAGALPGLLPGGRPSPTPPPEPRWPGSGARARCRTCRAATRRRSSPPPRKGSWARW